MKNHIFFHFCDAISFFFQIIFKTQIFPFLFFTKWKSCCLSVYIIMCVCVTGSECLSVISRFGQKIFIFKVKCLKTFSIFHLNQLFGFSPQLSFILYCVLYSVYCFLNSTHIYFCDSLSTTFEPFLYYVWQMSVKNKRMSQCFLLCSYIIFSTCLLYIIK